jgi:putative hydrolase of the HAD superfamily
MLRDVLCDFNDTLARLSSWGAPHHTAFACYNLLQDATRWRDGWLAGPADGEVYETHSQCRESYHRWKLNRLRSRARGCGVAKVGSTFWCSTSIGNPRQSWNRMRT